MPIAMLLKKSNLKLLPRVHHTIGFPPELSGGVPQQPMPMARVLVVEEQHGQLFLIRYDEEGNFAGDTWHRNLDDAKHQAEFEYGPLLDEWRDLPPEVKEPRAVVDFLLREAGEG